jgi:transposase
VKLTQDDRQKLEQLVRQGTQSARVIRRAHTLLLADDGKDDLLIAEVLHSGRSTVRRTRERYAQGDLDAALYEGKRAGSSPKLNPKQQAMLIAIACSDTPDGRNTWTMQMLADRLVELGVVGDISDETVRRTLKKTRSSRGRNGTGASPR